MHALHKLQQSFAADIWEPGLNRLDGVILDGRFPADRLFQVYRNNFWIATEDALSAIYGVVKRLVGDQFFTLLVDHFLRSYPPRFGNMLQLGSDLPVFLSDFKLTENLPYLSDIARLEWAYHEVFHARGTRPFNTQTLATIPSQKIPLLHFDISSSSRLVNSIFPIFEIWCVNLPDYKGDQTVDLDTGGDSVLLTRPDLVVELQKLEPADARFLQSLATGGSLDKATKAALNVSKNFNLEQALVRYLVTGTLVLKDENSSGSALTYNHPGGKQP